MIDRAGILHSHRPQYGIRLTEAPAIVKPGAGSPANQPLVHPFPVTLARLWCYAGIRQVLPGSQSHRCPEAHRRGQPLQSEARSAKNAPESTICGVLRKWSTTTGSVLLLVPISFPRSAPRRVSRTNLQSDALLVSASPTHAELCGNFVLSPIGS